MNIEAKQKMEVLSWEEEGFRPLISFGDWLVALLNWELRFDKASVGQVERHNETDEVFVLLQGHSIIFVVDDESAKVKDMEPGVVYNVTRSAWHSVIGDRSAKWLIVESNTTSQENSDFRPLNEQELRSLESQYPKWLLA